MARLVAIDGTDFGTLVRYMPDSLGGATAVTSKVEYLRKYYVNDLKAANKTLKSLFQIREQDPDHLKVFLALVRRTYETVKLPPDPFLNKTSDNPDVYIAQIDGRGNPVPLEALVTPSPKERDRLSKLYKYYSAFVNYAYPAMVREIDLYRQTVKYQQMLLNTRDYEVNTLLEANTRIQQVLKNAYATITNLSGQISMLEQIVQLSSVESDKWREAAQNAVKLMPTITSLLHQVAQEISRAMTLTMQHHASELSRSEAFETTINNLLAKIKELETQQMKYISAGIAEARSLEAPAAPAKSEGGESGEGGEQSE